MMIPLCNCQSFSYNDFTFGILLYKYMDLFLLIFLPCLINFQIYTYAWSLEFSWNFPRIELDYKNITKWKIIIFKDSGAWLKQGGYFLHEKEGKISLAHVARFSRRISLRALCIRSVFLGRVYSWKGKPAAWQLV